MRRSTSDVINSVPDSQFEDSGTRSQSESFEHYSVGQSTFYTTDRPAGSVRGTHRRRRSTGNGNSPAKTGSEQKSFENSPRAKRVLRLHQDELDEVVQQSGLDAETVHEKFSQFCTITEGKPSKGISERQFYKFYRRAYPSSMNPTKLSESLFRLCDLEGKSNLDFREYVASFCVYPTRVPTYQKFRTVFRIWDFQRLGYLTPGTLLPAMRDFYDILGLLSVSDHHKDAMNLFQKMDKDGDCKVFETEFVDEMIKDPGMVKLMEDCNFCVPSPDSYRGPSYFFGNPVFN